MIKFHRPSFLIAQPGTPPAQRTLFQKIFHKKKDDLSPDQRREMQVDADRSSRTQILSGLISIERKKLVSSEHEKPDLQSLTTSTGGRLRALAGRIRELPEQNPEHISAGASLENVEKVLSTLSDSPDRLALSTSTSGRQHNSFSHLPKMRHHPFSSLRISTGAAASSQERKDTFGWPIGLKAFGGKVPPASKKRPDIATELPSVVAPPVTIDPTRPNPRASEAAQLIEEMSAQHPAYTKIESDAPGNWLEDTGISIAPNSGHGNDCLILSLLQHATGNYAGNAESLEGAAKELRQELIEAGFAAEFEKNQMLPVDSDGFLELVNRVNARYPQANMDVRIAVIDASGRPYFPDNSGGARPIAARPNPEGNPVAILHQDSHYEALYSEHVSVTSDPRPLKASTQSPDNIAQAVDDTLVPEKTITTQTQAQEENQLPQEEGRQWVDQALVRLKGLSSELKPRFLKKSASAQYLYAKSLSSEQRSQLEEVLESQFRGDAGIAVDKKEADEVVNAWLSIQQARLRTHTEEERSKLQGRRGRDIFLAISVPPLALSVASLHINQRRSYYNSPSRPEYSSAFNNFMRILGDDSVSENLKEIIKQRLTYHWKQEETIAPYESSLLGTHGIDKLVESNYRNVPPDTNVGRDLARQTLTLGERMNVCLKGAKRPSLINPERFDLEQYADAFARLLERLSETTDAYDRRTRAGLYEKAADTIEAIQDDAKLRRKVFESAKDGLGACHDNVAEAFGSVANEVAIHQLVKDIDAEKIGKHNLLSWMKSQFRLMTLEKYVDQLIEDTIVEVLPKREQMTSQVKEIESRLKEQFRPDEVIELNKQLNKLKGTLKRLNRSLENLSQESVETRLLFKTRLKKELALPNSVPETMAFSRYSPFQKEDLVAAQDHVLKVEKEGTELLSFLKEFSAWEAGLKKLYPEKFAKVEEKFKPEEDELYASDADIPDAEEDPEGAAEYAGKVVDLGERKNQAIQQVIAELTDEQLKQIDVAPPSSDYDSPHRRTPAPEIPRNQRSLSA